MQFTRRATLGALGAAVVAVLSACGDPGKPVASGTDAPFAPESATPTATPTAPPKPTFVSDYTLPPVVDGLAPVITKIDTKQPVVFLTIDDGNTKTPNELQLLADYDYPCSLFLTKSAIQDKPGFFKDFLGHHCLIENHTISHNVNMVKQWGYQQQLNDIAGMQDYAVQQFGRRPVLFRPPGGAYSNAMRAAVAAAGLKAIITWEAKANAGRMDYQVGNSLRPGDIVLMHFRPEFAADLAAFRAAQQAAGLHVVLLEDFLGLA
ncbi:polysaccharide deacetylase family protein [Arthrobacter sp. ISL-72]|uniref:polysaccharide deacetylase family protein n=1 Tax=Arthrobacter sp. ISL-72 TaxID=2819114 RepID=UPI002035B90A|nr:polysaccharide deacetylase family protein [Arthrobacter sp. ISL-72]